MLRSQNVRYAWLAACGVAGACAGTSTGTRDQPITCPRLWDEAALRDWATPVAGLDLPPSFASPAEYYARPVDNLRTWPVYHPDREPPGYREGLVARGPQPLIEPAKLKTEADWIEAGRVVFESLDTPAARSDAPEVIAYYTSAAAIDALRSSTIDVMTADGILIDYRWVVDHDGRLKLGLTSCAGCHTRLMQDGTVLNGAPSNYNLSDSAAVGKMLEQIDPMPGASAGESFYAQHGVPWRADDPHLRYRAMDATQLAAALPSDTGAPPGTMIARFNGSPLHSTRAADLRGIRHRRWLDATASHQHRGPADLARYAILVEYADVAVFGPHRMLPDGAALAKVRPPDEAMYAMAMYLESLETAPSPHPVDAMANRGAAVFRAEGCARCHAGPHYTSNELVAVPGFEPPAPAERPSHLNVSRLRVNTDPALALHTRKGTGYYRVPSLRGLWYRGLFEHSGSVATLEEWFDARRLDDDHVPGGWRGPGVQHRAVPGHKYGLRLSPDDKRALIAFLLTL